MTMASAACKLASTEATPPANSASARSIMFLGMLNDAAASAGIQPFRKSTSHTSAFILNFPLIALRSVKFVASPRPLTDKAPFISASTLRISMCFMFPSALKLIFKGGSMTLRSPSNLVG